MDRDDAAFIDSRSLLHTAGSMRQTLQTLLSSVDSMAEHLDPENEDCLRHASAALRSIYQLIRISDNLSAFSMLQDGSYPLCLRRQSVFGAVSAVAEQAAGLLQLKQITLELKLPERDYIGQLDDRLLSLMLWNLLANAAAHTDDGRLSLQAERRGQAEILICLTNWQKDAAPLELEALFDRYSRAPEDQRNADGLGVGLRLVQQAAALHGGGLLISTTPEGKVTAVLRLQTEKLSAENIQSPVLLPEQQLNDGLIALSPILPDSAFDPRDVLW